MTTTENKPPISPSPLPKMAPLNLARNATPRRHRLRRTLIIVGSVLFFLIVVGGWVMYRTIAAVNTQDGTKRIGIIQQLSHIVTAGKNELKGESEDRVNILLMGYGGPGHDGPYLTDTMMVISYKPSTKQVAMLSIPRDLVVNIPGYNYQKINAALTYGRNQDYPGGGEALAVKVVSDLLDLPIQYYARVDFSGFEQIIDKLGGINVTVDNAFSDYSYPTNNYGYQTIRFNTGTQVMDGATALKFARSRHGNNGEGTDFARAKRQQKILEGIKEKVLSIGTLLNPIKLTDVIKTLGSHSQTNMEVWEMIRLGNIAQNIAADHIINRVFDDRPMNLLRSATGSNGAYILVPRSGNYDDMKYFAKNIFGIAAANAENAPVMIINHANSTAIGTADEQALNGFGVTVTKTIFAKPPYGKTIIIDTTAGANPATIALLQNYTHSTIVVSPVKYTESTNDTSILKYLEPTTGQTTTITPKLILILGVDQPSPGKSLFNFSTGTKTTNTNANVNKNTNKNTNTSTNKNKNTNKNTNTATKNTNTSTNTNHSVNTNTSS